MSSPVHSYTRDFADISTHVCTARVFSKERFVIFVRSKSNLVWLFTKLDTEFFSHLTMSAIHKFISNKLQNCGKRNSLFSAKVNCARIKICCIYSARTEYAGNRHDTQAFVLRWFYFRTRFRVFLNVSHTRGCSAVTDTSFARRE